MSSSSKSEEPTPKKLSDARDKGQVPRSKELASALLMVGFLVLFYLASPHFYNLIDDMISHVLAQAHKPFLEVLSTIFIVVFKNSLNILWPILLMMFVITVFGTLAQGGWVFSFHPLKPQIENLSPAKTLKQIFSLKNIIELLKSLFKTSVLGFICYRLIIDNFDSLMQLPYCGLECVLQVWGHLALMMFVYCAAFYMAIAIFDAIFQHTQHIKSLKMTPEEVKQEFKDMEGNYEIKGMRTSLYRDIISEGVSADVKKSSVIVTNPTHLAIGLYYEKGKTDLPIITMKETGLAAKTARELAEKFGVPIIQNIPVARKLMSEGTKNDRIPHEMIADVAKIIRWLIKIQKKQNTNNHQSNS